MLVRNRLWIIVERQEAIAEDHIVVQFHLAELEDEHPVLARLSVELQDLNARLPKVSWRGYVVGVMSSAAGPGFINKTQNEILNEILNENWDEELFEGEVVVLSTHENR
jgi:hypothetical protein